jgi:hypothetical protein
VYRFIGYQIITSQNLSKVVSKIKWIEKGTMEQPLPDHRKYIIWRIFSPYLLNVKKLPRRILFCNKDVVRYMQRVRKIELQCKDKDKRRT